MAARKGVRVSYDTQILDITSKEIKKNNLENNYSILYVKSVIIIILNTHHPAVASLSPPPLSLSLSSSSHQQVLMTAR